MKENKIEFDNYLETERKIKKWKDNGSMNGYYSAWEIKRILSNSKYISYIKSFVHNRSPDAQYYENEEIYWNYALPEMQEEYVCNLLLSVWINEVVKLISLLSQVRTKFILSGSAAAYQGKYTENIIIDNKQLQVIISSDKNMPLKEPEKK